MRTETIKELTVITNYLDSVGEYPTSESIRNLIRAELMIKDAKERKFDVSAWVTDDKLRRAINGVHYEEGLMIATNAHILVAVKSDYDPSLDGKTIARDGAIIDSKFPNWRAVIPSPTDGRHETHETVTISPYSYIYGLKEARARYILENNGKKTQYQENWYVKVGHAYFKPKFFDKILSFMALYGISDVDLYDQTLVAKAGDGSIAIAMGCVFGSDPLEIIAEYKSHNNGN